jgi:hypothetical protein
MSEKRSDKLTSRPVSDESEDGKWTQIDCSSETGPFAIVTDVLPAEAAPKPSSSSSAERPRRRTLDDMRRLSEEIKRKRQSGG